MDYDSYRDRFQRLNEATDYIPAGLLCHYTSLSGLKGIMSSKKLWFSDSACLNDKTEGKYIYDVLKDCLFDIKNKSFVDMVTEQILKNAEATPNVRTVFQNEYAISISQNGVVKDKYFICCFSEENDELSMWNYYTKSANCEGCNLMFKTDEIWYNIHSGDKDWVYNVNIYKVIYDSDEQTKIIEDMLSLCLEYWDDASDYDKQQMIWDLGDYIEWNRFRIKHPAFKNEAEVRMVITITYGNYQYNMTQLDEEQRTIKTRHSNGLDIPYIEVPFWDMYVTQRITLSPTATENDEKMVHDLIYEHGFEHCGVHKSDIPLRY